MSKSKYFDKIAWVVVGLMLVITLLLMYSAESKVSVTIQKMGYEDRLFDATRVHSIHIVMNDWEKFIENAATEEYYTANLIIDGKSYKNVGIRGKGNMSLSHVKDMNSQRYSLKVEFDHYDRSITYYGLDKLSLNNLIQDSTMMKDYLTYTMMNKFGVASPLCSFVYLTVNGQDWGFYLAVEGVENSFLTRNYGVDYGELYKPESMGADGKNKKPFLPKEKRMERPGMLESDSSDVKLQYVDDYISSYTNIWNNAKTDITTEDQNRLIASLKELSIGEQVESVVDVEQVIRYFVVHNYVCNEDSYTGSRIHNYYLYEKNGKMTMIPWDYNLAFGTFQGSRVQNIVNTPIDAPISEDFGKERPMWDWILSKESYRKLYHEYFTEFLNTVDIEESITNTYELIKSYVEKDPTSFYSMQEFETGVETLRQFCTLRSKSILKQLEYGETENHREYVDASTLNLSDMGTMEIDGNFESHMQRPTENIASNRNGWIWIGFSVLILYAGLWIVKMKF